jgi:hypothetical protein
MQQQKEIENGAHRVVGVVGDVGAVGAEFWVSE